MKLVKFVKPHSPYAEGDIAGIADKEAEELVKSGVAVEYKNKKDSESKDPEKEVETENLDQPVEDKMVKGPVNKK